MNRNENRIAKIPYASGFSNRVSIRLLPSFMTAVTPKVNVDENNSPLRLIRREN
jgi:hypothetical protein